MKNLSTEKLNLTQRDRKKLDRFKEYAVSPMRACQSR